MIGKKPFYWQERAAKQGHADAQFFLGFDYERDLKLKDYKKAIYWYKKSAQQGISSAYKQPWFYVLMMVME